MTDLGRAVCTDLAGAEQREWLVTNGLGSFASGTVAGTLTRRYHGLLIAALQPPLGRTYVFAKLDESVRYDGREYALGANRWRGGAVDPAGFIYLAGFALEGSVPVWTFACADLMLEKRVWMEQGAHTTYVTYRVRNASKPLELNLKALVNYRDFHATTRAGDWCMRVEPLECGVRVVAFEGASALHLRSDRGECGPAHVWYRDFDLPLERMRGLDDRDDHLHAATFSARLETGDSLTVVASLAAESSLDGEPALARQHAHEAMLLEAFAREHAAPSPAWVRQLVLAADQFVVRRPLSDDGDARSIVAGYHWFGDWGRDTMIALPGLTLATGRAQLAGKVLETFARYVDGGMLPNYFPDAGTAPEYNSVDAPLWFVEAVRAYVDASGDIELLRRLFPALAQIVRCFRDGTLYGIGQDPRDGLIAAGEPGVQLTWMDAKVGDWVVTPRTGKAVEINALWYNALRAMAGFAQRLGLPHAQYAAMASATRDGFARFWNAGGGFCYDVLDGPGGHDARLRPNQLFAVALEHSPLEAEQQRAIVEICGRKLLAPSGLRSLADDEPDFRPVYGGSPFERDGAYHQGTVWCWLIGAWAAASLRTGAEAVRVRSQVEALAAHLDAYGLGTLYEIADGIAPHRPNGCIAQAWSVAEVLRTWHALSRLPQPLC
jgi:predicted glycogen debranching enzyme